MRAVPTSHFCVLAVFSQQWEADVDRYLQDLLANPAFERYNQAFDKFGFGLRTRAWLLIQCFPIQRFSRVSELTGQRSYSLPAFKQYLGCGRVDNSSGDKESSKRTGSKVGRSALFLYVTDVIVPRRGGARSPLASAPLAAKLCEYYDRRMAEFNPDDWQNRQVARVQVALIDKLLKQLSHLGDSSPAMAAIAATKQEIIAGKAQAAGNSFQAKLGFKKLLVCNTAAKAVKLLFRELTK